MDEMRVIPWIEGDDERDAGVKLEVADQNEKVHEVPKPDDDKISG